MPAKQKPQIHIDTTQIPDYVRDELLAIIYDATIAYFRQPGVPEKFERWKAAKEAARAAEQNKRSDNE